MLTISAVHNVHVWYACEYCIRNYLVCRNLMAAAKIVRSSLASYTISNSRCMMHKQLSKIIMRWYNAPGEPSRLWLVKLIQSSSLIGWFSQASPAARSLPSPGTRENCNKRNSSYLAPSWSFSKCSVIKIWILSQIDY